MPTTAKMKSETERIVEFLKGRGVEKHHSPAVEWVYLKMFVKVFFSFDYSNIGVLLLNSGGCEVLTLGQFKIYTIVDARVTLTQKYRKMAITSILLRIES